MCMIFIAVCQVAFAEDPAADGLGAGDGTNIAENGDEGLGDGDAGQIDDGNLMGRQSINRKKTVLVPEKVGMIRQKTRKR